MNRIAALILIAAALPASASASSVSPGERNYRVISTSIIMLGEPAKDEPKEVQAAKPRFEPAPMVMRGGDDGSNVAVKADTPPAAPAGSAPAGDATAKASGENKPADTAQAAPSGAEQPATDPGKTAAVDAPKKRVAEEQ